MLKSILLTCSLALLSVATAQSQSCGNDSKYNIPYKNTYTKEPLVAENEYRIAKPVTIEPRSFDEARDILPKPVLPGHAKEFEMYWKAWEIATGNICPTQSGAGFVSSYIDTDYHGNTFLWDCAFIFMFSRYGTAFFTFLDTC